MSYRWQAMSLLHKRKGGSRCLSSTLFATDASVLQTLAGKKKQKRAALRLAPYLTKRAVGDKTEGPSARRGNVAPNSQP